MNVLAFDTATEILTVCLKKNDQVFEHTLAVGLEHAERLLPLIEHSLREGSLDLTDMDLIVTTRGPGSFTGLRIGMSTAKGLAFGSGCPVVSVPSLDVYAKRFSWFDGAVVPVIDAKKKRFYAGIYCNGSLLGEYLDIEAVVLTAMLSAWEKVLITGPHAGLFWELMEQRMGYSLDAFHRAGNGIALIEAGIEAYTRKGADAPETSPLYIRKTEAELTVQGGSNV